MLKYKRILLMITLLALLFLVPNICNAAAINATQTTTTSTGKTVKWSYELEGDSAVNLTCTNISSISGTVDIPSKIDGYTVTTIGCTNNNYSDGAFEGCAGITGVTIPDTVTKIGYRAFYECTGLKSVIIPDSVVEIQGSAFSGDTGITNITLSKNLSSIGNGAFSSCTGLKSITIPDSVTAISTNAFYNCTALTSVKLSENLTAINYGTFEGCSSLESIKIPSNVTSIFSEYDWGFRGAFEDCTRLKKILIPDSVVTITNGVFDGCSEDLVIYGNDNQVSKQYAEENQIKFDYIANWNENDAGSDITAPTVNSIKIKYTSVLGYYDTNTNTFQIPSGAQITIVVNFSEEITGTTAPTLSIKCGTGSTIDLTNGVITGSIINYTYTIQSIDAGIITAESLTGGNITDLAGNQAQLSSPQLSVEYSENLAYANGNDVLVVPDDEENNEEGNNNNDGESYSEDKYDPTIIDDKELPQTGIGVLTAVLMGLIVVAIISKIKCEKYKDI